MYTTNSNGVVTDSQVESFMKKLLKDSNEVLDELFLAVEADAHFNLAPCEEPDCSIHPGLLLLAEKLIA